MANDEEEDGDSVTDNPSETFARVKIPRELHSRKRRKDWGLPDNPDDPGPYIVELNLQHMEGLPGAASALRSACARIGVPPPRRVSKTYYSCSLNVEQVRGLAVEDERQAKEAAEAAVEDGDTGASASRYTAIFRVWPDFKVKSQIDASTATVKADAAVRAYAASGDGIVWAVLDSGIDFKHPHFGDVPAGDDPPTVIVGHTLLDESVAALHRSFCPVKTKDEWGQVQETQLDDPDDLEDERLRGLADRERRAERRKRIAAHRKVALSDRFGHGTHVAGIIGGGLLRDTPPVDEKDPKPKPKPYVFLREYKADEKGVEVKKTYGTRRATAERLRGVAPNCKIVSLRVLDDDGGGRTSDVIRALEYIREKINDDPKLLRVHGINLSVGYEFDAELFACGQSPVCAEVDRLVQAGVVVVTAAGNTGYGHVQALQRVAKVGLSNTINDPGNAALGITVGSTHRDSPHTYGVSYFSSKGPTGDGRLKPDLVAPGERITSCATGRKLDPLLASMSQAPADNPAYYVDDSGTSMAAPHVSGAIAAFLSIRREFIGKPQEVKRIFLESATPLGRERYFEGHGLLDLMRAIQSV